MAVLLPVQVQLQAVPRWNSGAAVREPELLSLIQARRQQLVPERPLSDAER